MKRQKKKLRKIKKKWFSKCPNCGEKGPHFVPPSCGEPGFFTCKKSIQPDTTPDAKSLCKMVDKAHKDAEKSKLHFP